MGITASSSPPRHAAMCAGPNNLPPLQFHPVHGDNIRLSRDGTLAKRYESFCKGVTFSARPVKVNERVYVKFTEIAMNWSGVIRFGFTYNDPATLRSSLSKYACPDLTNKPGFWAKALNERFCERDNILSFYVTSSGDVNFGINGEEKGVFITGVETRGPLWTLIDVYGNCTAIEFIDGRYNNHLHYHHHHHNQPAPLQSNQQIEIQRQLSQQQQQQQQQQRQIMQSQSQPNHNNNLNHHHQQQQQQLQQQQQQQQLQLQQQQCSAASAATSRNIFDQPEMGLSLIDDELYRDVIAGVRSLALPSDPIVLQNESELIRNTTGSTDEFTAAMARARLNIPRVQNDNSTVLYPMMFHRLKGRNIILSSDRLIATRSPMDFCHGYVFSCSPILIYEEIIIEILRTDDDYIETLSLGLTSCNPATIEPSDLPDDSDLLLDRPEYWVVRKDFAPESVAGDQIKLFISHKGEVIISKNNGPSTVIMHVDQTLQLWPFIDVFGATASVRIHTNRVSSPGRFYEGYVAESPTHLRSDLLDSINNINMHIAEQAQQDRLRLKQQQQQQQQQQLQQQRMIANRSTELQLLLQQIEQPQAQPQQQPSQQPSQQQQQQHPLNRTSHGSTTISTSSSLSSLATSASAHSVHPALSGLTRSECTTPTNSSNNRVINVPTSTDMIQLATGGTVLVVNLPPATSNHSTVTASSSAVASTSSAAAAAAASTNNINLYSPSNIKKPSTSALVMQAGLSSTCLQNAYSQQGTNANGTPSITTTDNGTFVNGMIPNQPINGTECTICYENPIDSVLYICGHMCMCYNCAIQQWRGIGGGHCPLCRARIRDVIRTYKS